jgi:hypothetical protein
MSYIFQNDIDFLLKESSFEDIFKVTATHPIIIKKYLSKEITLETLVILNKLLSYIKDFDKQISDPLIWPELKRKVVKYEPFLSVDKSKYRKILLSKLS